MPLRSRNHRVAPNTNSNVPPDPGAKPCRTLLIWNTQAPSDRHIAPAVGLLAAGLLVWQGSYAAFSGHHGRHRQHVGRGNLVLTNNGGTAVYAAATSATFGGTERKPGRDRDDVSDRQEHRQCRGHVGHVSQRDRQNSAPSLGAQIQLTVTEAVPATDVQANCVGFPASGLTTVATNQPL